MTSPVAFPNVVALQVTGLSALKMPTLALQTKG